jgi:hypothetical protein
VYRSEDGGASWTATAPLINPSVGTNQVVVYALAISADGSGLYAGTRTKNAPSLGYGGVFKSSNHGVSWSLVNNGLPASDLYVYDVAVDPTNSAIVYAGLHGNGLYRSDNSAAYWKRVYEDSVSTTALRVVAIDPVSPNIIVFGTVERPSYRSTNYGDSWTNINRSNIYSLSNDVSHANGLYAAVQTSSAINLYYSSNFGATLSARAANLPTPYIYAIPANGSTLFLGGGNDSARVYKSTDGGYGFSASSSGISGYPVTGLVIDPSNSNQLMASLFGVGVKVSSDGGSNWVSKNSGLPTTSIQALAMDPSNASVVYALALDYGVYKTVNGGGSWFAINSGYPSAAQSLNGNKDLPYQPMAPLEPPSGNVDDSKTLSLSATTSVPGLSAAVSTTGVVLLGTSGRGVLKGNGSSWSATNIISGSIYTVVFDRGNPTQVWFGGNSSAGSFRSSFDSGATWGAGNAALAGRTVYSISQGALDANVLLAGTDAGAYLSFDRGITWSAAGLSGAVRAVAVHPSVAKRLLAATATSVYISHDNGLSWKVIDPTMNLFGYLGVATTPAAADYFYFYSRYGGVVRFID